jgi:hypothetical protein
MTIIFSSSHTKYLHYTIYSSKISILILGRFKTIKLPFYGWDTPCFIERSRRKFEGGRAIPLSVDLFIKLQIIFLHTENGLQIEQVIYRALRSARAPKKTTGPHNPHLEFQIFVPVPVFSEFWPEFNGIYFTKTLFNKCLVRLDINFKHKFYIQKNIYCEFNDSSPVFVVAWNG